MGTHGSAAQHPNAALIQNHLHFQNYLNCSVFIRHIGNRKGVHHGCIVISLKYILHGMFFKIRNRRLHPILRFICKGFFPA